MKTKIFSFLLILVAVQATVACRADAGEINFPVARPVPPPDLFPDPEEDFSFGGPTFFEDDFPDDVSDTDFEVPSFDLERITTIRQSLVGIYQGTIHNQEALYIIRPVGIIHSIRDGIQRSGTYIVDFRHEEGIFLSFQIEGVLYEYRLHLSLHDNDQVLSLSPVPINNGSSSFVKLQNNINEGHDPNEF